jgi:hypothetical protein
MGVLQRLFLIRNAVEQAIGEELPAVIEPETKPSEQVIEEASQIAAVTNYLLELDARGQLFLEPPNWDKEWFEENR